MGTDSGKVGAIILGAQKCGTTTLFEVLSRWPDINASLKKELDFWAHTNDWRAEIDSYHAMFADRPGLKLEASPSYSSLRSCRGIWDDMYAYNPDLKLFYLYRHPLDRMRSAYRHGWERGWFEGTFAEFLMSEWPVGATCYAARIEPFIRRFGSNQLMLIDMRDLTGTSREATLASVANFLGVALPKGIGEQEVHANRGEGRKIHYRYENPVLPLRILRKVWPRAFRVWARLHSPPALTGKPKATEEEERAFLVRIEDDIRAFEAIVGRAFPEWREP